MQTDAHLGGWEVKMGEMTGILGRLWGVMGGDGENGGLIGRQKGGRLRGDEE